MNSQTDTTDNLLYNTGNNRQYTRKYGVGKTNKNGGKGRSRGKYFREAHTNERRHQDKVRHAPYTLRIEAQPDAIDEALENMHYANFLGCSKLMNDGQMRYNTEAQVNINYADMLLEEQKIPDYDSLSEPETKLTLIMPTDEELDEPVANYFASVDGADDGDIRDFDDLYEFTDDDIDDDGWRPHCPRKLQNQIRDAHEVYRATGVWHLSSEIWAQNEP